MLKNKIESTELLALGFYRIWDIIGDPARGIEPLLPISRSSFLNGVKSGKYPAAVRLGENTLAWRKVDILKLLTQLGGEQ